MIEDPETRACEEGTLGEDLEVPEWARLLPLPRFELGLLVKGTTPVLPFSVVPGSGIKSRISATMCDQRFVESSYL